MKGRIYLYKSNSFYPVYSVDVSVPDEYTPEEQILLSTHQLMSKFRVELIPESYEDTKGSRDTKRFARKL